MTTDRSLQLDDSPTIWSAQFERGDERPLVVLLHGRGSNERDLFSLVPLLPTDAVYASVRAPLAEGAGWSWFATGVPGAPDPASAIRATIAVLDWFERVAPAGPVAVLGFSQGGAMALQLMRFAPDRIRAFVNLAGFVIADAHRDPESDAALATLAPPVFWGRDPRDPVIPQAAIERTTAWLPGNSTLTAREYPGIGHSVSRDEIDEVAAFLTRELTDPR